MFLINRLQGCFLIFPSGIWFVAKISQNLAYVSYKVSLMNHNECIACELRTYIRSSKKHDT